ncbi:MAG TPA: VOC family protein [Luteimicrobium sp.]|nr:VOC family protein [Luteimicrobium sp.]
MTAELGTAGGSAGRARVGTAFVPVSDPERSADWYAAAFGLRVAEVSPWAANLEAAGGTTLTLMGPASGMTSPGLGFATHNLVVGDLDATRERFAAEGRGPGTVEGDPAVCRFFTLQDPDGNVVLVCDR